MARENQGLQILLIFCVLLAAVLFAVRGIWWLVVHFRGS